MINSGNEKKQARGFLQGALLLIPNFLKLLYRLLKDSRVPAAEKALLVGAIVYVISPLDFIPDVIPFVGQIDDLYLIALVIIRMLSRTSDDVIEQHWEGSSDIIKIVDTIVNSSRYFLPKKIRQVLLGRVEVAPQVRGGFVSSPALPDDLDAARKRRDHRK